MKIKKLEAIRGLVAIYIVFHHMVTFNKLQDTSLPLKLIFMHPQEAVLLFFLMSGFVIFLSAVNSRNFTFAQYFKKRFVRIYPITIAACLISTFIFLINCYQFTSLDVKTLAGNICMLQDLEVQPGHIVTPYLKNYPLWSLSYEWWFYMMFFPLFIYLRQWQRQPKFPFIYLILCLSLTGWILYLTIPNYFFLVITYFLLWWSGVACAEVYLAQKNFTFKNLLPVFISLSIMSAAISFPILYKYFVKHQTYTQINVVYPFTSYIHYYLAALFFLIVGLVWWKFQLRGFNTLIGKFRSLASISFALYIVHFPFLWLEMPFIRNLYLLYAVKLVLILLTAYLLEIKMQPLMNKLFHNKIKPRKAELEQQAF